MFDYIAHLAKKLFHEFTPKCASKREQILKNVQNETQRERDRWKQSWWKSRQLAEGDLKALGGLRWESFSAQAGGAGGLSECVGGRIMSLYTLREPHRPYFCCRCHLLCCCPWIFQGGITHQHRGCIWNRSTKWAPGATSGPVPSSHSLSLCLPCWPESFPSVLYHWFSTGFKTLHFTPNSDSVQYQTCLLYRKCFYIQTLKAFFLWIVIY